MQSFDVKGMTCDHCVRAVTDAVRLVDPAATVEVDLDAGTLRVRNGTATAADIVRAIEAEGYTAVP